MGTKTRAFSHWNRHILILRRRKRSTALKASNPIHPGMAQCRGCRNWQIEHIRAVIMDLGRSNSRMLLLRSSWSGRK